MAGKIFINYRRDDDPNAAGRLFDRLHETFAADQLFMDIDNIAPGLDFVRVLDERVAECDVLLAIIGKGWINARNAAGGRRLDDPADFVRIEIQSALSQDKRVIPVLVGEVHMPRADELPEALRPLASRNAVRLTYEQFHADTQRLIKALQHILEETGAPILTEERSLRQPGAGDGHSRQNAAIEPAAGHPVVNSPAGNDFRTVLIAAISVFLTLGLMIFVVWVIVNMTDNWVEQHIGSLLGKFDPDQLFHGADSVLIAVLALLVLGFFTANLIGRKLVSFGASILSRTPVTRPIYRTTEQIVQTVLSNERSSRNAAAAVTLNQDGTRHDAAAKSSNFPRKRDTS
jgi:hypothetical protein